MKEWMGGDVLLCPECSKEVDKLLDDGDNKQDAETELEQAHEQACKNVAKLHGTTHDFVNWLIYVAEDEDIEQDDLLINMYCLLSDAYDTEYKKLTGIDISWPATRNVFLNEA
jgi:hypothetical protein